MDNDIRELNKQIDELIKHRDELKSKELQEHNARTDLIYRWNKILDCIREYNLNVRLQDCWKFYGSFTNCGSPEFSHYSCNYELPVGFLDGKPVFQDSIIYKYWLDRQVVKVDLNTHKFSSLILDSKFYFWASKIVQYKRYTKVGSYRTYIHHKDEVNPETYTPNAQDNIYWIDKDWVTHEGWL